MTIQERDERLSINNDGRRAVTLMRRQLLENYPQRPSIFDLDKLEMAINQREIEQAYQDYYGNSNSMQAEN